MNTTLSKQVLQADGRYFNDLELQTLEQYQQTFSLRLQTYHLLSQQADSLIMQTLRRMLVVDRAAIQAHGETCKRDMGYVLRSVALAILKDDEEGYKQTLILWMQNIMAALNKESQSSRAYRLMQEVVRETMPLESAGLVNHYLELFITALNAGN